MPSAWQSLPGPFVSSRSDPATALAHERHALDGLERADEDGMRDVRDAGDHVELMVHAVDEVDVGGAADAVHRLRPPGAAAAIGMRGPVRGPAIRLGLDDGARDARAIRGGHDEALAEEISATARTPARV